jgi:hypothetical protein
VIFKLFLLPTGAFFREDVTFAVVFAFPFKALYEEKITTISPELGLQALNHDSLLTAIRAQILLLGPQFIDLLDQLAARLEGWILFLL